MPATAAPYWPALRLLAEPPALPGELLVGTVLAILVLLAMFLFSVPSFLGYESLVVLSGSMEPAMHVGDLAIVAPVPADALRVGDIITYRTPQQPDRVVTHRLVNIGQDRDGRPLFQTKGDANNTIDRVAIDQGAVMGRVALVVPQAGYLVVLAGRPEGKVLLIGLPLLLLAIDQVRSTRKRREQERAAARDAAAGTLVAQGRAALQSGDTKTALVLFDHAVAADPHQEDAWLGRAECLPAGPERQAALEAGLTVNPTSARLKSALEHTTSDAASG